MAFRRRVFDAPTRPARGSGRRVAAALLAAAFGATLILAGCSVETETPGATSPVTTATPAVATATVPATTSPATSTGATGSTGGALDEVPLYDPELFRDDVDCSAEFVTSGGGEDFPEAFLVAHYVVDGVLGEPCLGAEDERMLDAWYWLRVVAPAEDLHDLILLAGYEADVDLLAYVERLSGVDGSTSFQMTVNLIPEATNEIDLALTMAHEFTHVFTGRPDEIDRDLPEASCTTYYEGQGCYREGSYIARWTELFWGEWVADVDPDNATDDVASEARCAADDSFLGSYAASNPEEDFAETFSAYVYSVPVDTPGLIAKMEFMDADPLLRSYRDRVIEAGLPPLPNYFDGCGY